MSHSSSAVDWVFVPSKDPLKVWASARCYLNIMEPLGNAAEMKKLSHVGAVP